MMLEPLKDEPGAWTNPRWIPGTPGTFACVIGVSRYAHLDGSPASLDLGQLEVSALTAYRVFRWLATDYRVDGCPLARCWLLLSPTDAELQFEPDLKTHLHAPTFDNCDVNIGSWAACMSQLPPDAKQQSRGLFFFSGHGFELVRGTQVLLPADYLRPPTANWNRALSTSNLTGGLASTGVPLQLFFVDACRNAPTLPRGAQLTGTPILNDTNPQGRSYFAPVLYATNAGHRAFQQPHPTEGLSLFGGALLDGFAGKPDLELVETGQSNSVNLYPLQEFAMARVADRLEQENEVDPQPVSLGGAGIKNELVTELPAPQAGDRPWSRQWRGAGPGLVPPDNAVVIDLIGRSAAALDDRATGALREHGRLRGAHSEWSADADSAHATFGSENATSMWTEGLQLVAASTASPISTDALLVQRVLHDPAVMFWSVDFTIAHEDPVGHCLQLQDTAGHYWTTMLPELSGDGETVYRVQFALARSAQAGSRSLTRLHASISPESSRGRLAAKVWAIYSFAGFQKTLEAIKALMVDEESQLSGEPFACVLAGLMALRLGDLELAQALSTLPSQVPGAAFADLCALRAAVAAHNTDVDMDRGDAGNATRLLFNAAVPSTQLGVIAADNGARQLLQQRLTTAGAWRLQAVVDRLRSAIAALANGGMFATYVDMTATQVAAALLSTSGSPAVAVSRPPFERPATSEPRATIEDGALFTVRLGEAQGNKMDRVAEAYRRGVAKIAAAESGPPESVPAGPAAPEPAPKHKDDDEDEVLVQY